MKYSDGYVAFIDILGFSNYVLDENNAEKVSDLFDFVEKFCFLFNTSPDLGVNVSFFSDSIVLSSDELIKLSPPIYIAESYLKSKLKLLFRGGITSGKYYHSNGVTFGPAVVAAYRLENQAVYSRILVDERIAEKEKDDELGIFRDIDGKWCLNLCSLIVLNETSFGENGEEYPEGDPGANILNIFIEVRESILKAIKLHIGTPVAEKYIWRIRPFNYSCELFAKHPTAVPMFSDLDYEPPESFKNDLLKLRISNFDYE